MNSRTGSWLKARYAPWHFLYFLPEPHQQGSLRPMFSCSFLTTVSTTSAAAVAAAVPAATDFDCPAPAPGPAATCCSAEGWPSGVPPE